MGYFKGKKVLVYGMGTSGQAACKILHSFEACVSMYDDDSRFSNYFCYEKSPMEKDYDFIVVSPGVKVMGNKLLDFFAAKKTTIISELDLGFSFAKGKVIAITGTNGKTTTTSLLGDIFKLAGKETFVCGNIGLPISSVALETTKKSTLICEVSNFQLELSKVFAPDLACVLNLREDHIDRHGNFAEYVRVKNKISEKFTHKNILVVNADDEANSLVERRGKILYFSKKPLKTGAFVKNGKVYFNKSFIIDVKDIPLRGEKNLENVLACVALASAYKIKPCYIKEAILAFTPPAHRLQFIGEFNGVEYFDDSKSTNVACVEMALESLNRENLILMLGGQNKNCNFQPLFNKSFKIKQVVCFGEAAEQIASLASAVGYETCKFEHMVDATLYVKQFAISGDCVLFSPGCASFDEFGSYAARGQRFKEIVCGSEE